MFELTQAQLKTLYGDGGEPFRRFVNDLLRAEAFTCGVKLNQLDLQIRANVGDGGVDASVSTAIPNSKSGWFDAPTCWQYKAAAYTDTRALIREIEAEMLKKFASQKVANGYAYRFCMVASIPEQTVSEIEGAMLSKAGEICKNSDSFPQKPRLVHGGHLSAWAGMYPAVGVRVQGISGDFQLFSPWLSNQREVTRIYVKNQAWTNITEQIILHVDFSKPPIGGNVCYSIAGNSGVGKTRLVAETLNLIEAADALVLETDDGNEALRIASYLSQERHRHAILVVDECSPETLFDLQQRLRSFANSIRVIAIEHLDRVPIGVPENLGPWLAEPGTQTTLEILNQNFPSIHHERRRVYSNISEGFIRFAADLCNHDAEIDINEMTGSPRSIYAYLQRRIGGDREIDVIGSLVLFSKIGYRDDVSWELKMLSALTGISEDDYRKSIDRLRYSPGFVAQQGRYWYVTPEIVTRSLFAFGWRRFVQPDIRRFLEALSPEHLLQIQSRANAYGGTEVVSQLASYFQDQMNRLTIHELSDSRVTQIVLAVAESDLVRFLPILSDVICNSSDEQLAILDTMPNSTSWSSRRYLIFFLEKAVLFPEFFAIAERMLLRLSQCETEPNIANNATCVWAELFRVDFSGTSVDFGSRLKLLRSYLSDKATSELAIQAIKETLGNPGTKFSLPESFAGRRVPETWSPKSHEEEQHCLGETVQMCSEFLSVEAGQLGERLFHVLTGSLLFLTYRGLGKVLHDVLMPSVATDQRRRQLYNLLTKYQQNGFGKGQLSVLNSNELAGFFRGWSKELAPNSWSERMRSLISCEPWDERFNPEITGQRGALTDLADELLAQPQLLETELDWLASDEAQATHRIGFALGKVDTSFILAGTVCDDARSRQQIRLLAGYVSGTVYHSTCVPEIILSTVGYFCDVRPETALELLQGGGDHVKAFAHLVTLIEKNCVEPCQVVGFGHHYGTSALSSEQFDCLLKLLVEKSAKADGIQRQCVLRFASLFLRTFKHFHQDERLLDDSKRIGKVVELLDMTKGDVTSQTLTEWTDLAAASVEAGHNEAFPMLQELLLSTDITVCRGTLRTLTTLAGTHSGDVMDTFGNAILDKRGVYLRIHVCKDLIAAIDIDVVVAWLERKGHQAVAALARHLPQPFLDNDGKFIVPTLLERVLERFGTDDVLAAFHAGLNSTESYWGDLSPVLEERATRFKTLLNHSNPAIRRLAGKEVAFLGDWAKHEKTREREDTIAN